MLLRAMRPSALSILLLAGCYSASPRQAPPSAPPTSTRGTSATPRPQPIPDQARAPNQQFDELDDRTSIVPPPRPQLPSQPVAVEPAPQEGVGLARATRPDGPIQPVSATTTAEPVATVEKEDAATAGRRIHQRAVAAYAALHSFEARLTRRETFNGKANPQETIAYKFRKEPFSVRLKWLGQEGQGREVIYVQGQHGGKMHVMPAKQDTFLLPPVKMAFLPDDPMVRSKTRHDIREAGFGESIRQLGNLVEMAAKSPTGRDRLHYLGLVMRPEFQNRMECMEEIIPARTEALFPQGGKRVYFFDTGTNSPSNGLPVLVVAYDASTRKEVEYYCFDNFMHPINLSDKDFDPDQVFKKK